MNKVFKVIWSEARNAYVVVSEMAKSHGTKSCSTKKLLAMLIATGVMTCASMAPAMAADPPAEALKHSTVTDDGVNITVTDEGFNADGGKEYKVALKNDIYLAGDDPDALVSISGSKGTIWATGSVTVGSGVDGSVVMDGTTATVSGLGNTTTAYAGFANGKGKAATEEQLKEISEVAENANQGWNLSTNGGEASKVAPGENVDFSGDQNINISNDGTNVKVELKNDIYLAGDDPNAFVNISGSKGTIWATGSVTVGSGVDGSVVMDGTTATVSGLSNKTTAYDGFATTGKAATEEQLKEVATEAGKHTTVTDGANITVTEGLNEDGGKKYKVALNNDILLSGDNDAFVNISGSKGTIWTSGSVAAGNVVMDGATATVSGLGNTTTAYDGFANGKGKAATEEQLKEVATEAGKHTTVTDGANITVTEGLNEDGGKKYKVALNNDILLSGDNDAFVNISGSKGTIWTSGSVAAGNVVMDGATATVSGLGNTTTAYDGFANGKGKAATEEQLKEISKVAENANRGWNLSTNGGEASKVAPGETVDISGDKNINISNDGTNVKVKLNENIDVNSVQTNALNAKYNLSVGTANENGTVPFFVNSNGAFYAANGKLVVDKDGKVTATEGEIGNVVLKNGVLYKNTALRDGELYVGDADGNYSQITTKGAKLGQVTIDEKGNIAGVNSVQTNALNAKYNLSVGTANENGTVPFFVNSNGAFYAANGKLVVDKDGKVTATEGEIGNVVLKNGVLYKNTALRDGELYVGDASGNYSQITTKGAKLGKVTVAEDGKIFGVAAGAVTADSTDAVNGSQLHAVATEAGKHSKVVNGSNINVEEFDNDGQKIYKVNLNKDIMLGDLTGKNVSISGTNGTIETTGYIATKDRVYADKGAKLADIDVTGDKISNGASSIVLDGSNVKVNDKVTIDQNGNIAGVNSIQTNALNAKYNLSVGAANENGIMPFFVNSNGAFYGANNNFSVDKDGKVTATAGEIGNVVLQNGVYTGHSALRDGELFVGDASGNYSQITTKGAKLGKVTVAEDGKIFGVAAGAVTADSTDAVNGSQLHAVATEAGKHSKVVNGSNINVEEFDNDGQKIYKVNLNKDIMLGDLTGKNVSISGTNGTIETTGYIATKDRVYADKGAKLADIDVTGDKISNGASSIVLDGSNVKVNDKVTIDQNGNIAGVNSIQTNALNAKYNLSVGAANENGIMPFFVNSNGAFYGANNNFSVDKDGKVTATAGEIGNVVLQNGVYTGHSALRDGELFVGDASGNYSQITTKGAKLGKVTVAEDGKIFGVAAGAVTADSTDAVNGSQLHAVATEAGKHSKVVNGSNINVEEFDNDGQKIYKVNLNKDIMLGDLTGKNVSISGTNGTIETTGYIATKDRVYADKGAKLADIDVTGDTISNGDAKLALNGAAGTAGMINGKGASVYMQDGYTVINSKVAFDQNGKISGVAAGAVTADSTDAVNGSQLHAVATEAGKHSKVVNGSNINVEEFDNDGQKIYKVNLNKDIMLGDLTGKNVSISGTNGTIETTGYIATKDRVYADKGAKLADIDVTGNTISNGGATLTLGAMGGMVSEFANGQGASVKLFGDATIINGKVNVYNDGRIAGVAAGINDNDAVNVGQLKEAVEAGNTDTHIKPGEYGVGADNTVNMDVVDKNGNKVDTVTIKDVAKASDVGDVNNIASDIKNQDGSHTTVVDAVNNLNNKVGDLQYSKVEKGEIEDGDSTTTAIGKLDQKLTDVAATAAKHTKVEGSSNITVTNTAKEGEAANYKVELNKDIDVDTVTANSVTTGQTVMNNDGLKVGKDVSVTATAVTAGKTSISDEGVKVGDNTYISDKGLNANGQYITNVKAGEADTDAVNYGQLKDTNNHIDRVENQVVNNTNRINKLGSRVNKVGAGAAALAALHPMDFDPDDKLTFSAGYGNYGGENAAAIGAYYRPDEKVMFSVAGTVGNGENMVNAGVSFALDRTNHVSNSRTALAREVIDLRGQLAVMGAKMAKMEKAFGMLDETKTKLFPDVPANHWAYEYIAKLAGNGYIEGYPDGNFGGDRLMTRYEFAAMLYRAIENGAALEEKIIKEFEPELGRIRVDRISGEDGDRDKIERVRVNDTKGERDHYGNKLAK